MCDEAGQMFKLEQHNAFRIDVLKLHMSTSVATFDYLEHPEYFVQSNMSHDGFPAVDIEKIRLFGHTFSEDSESNVIGTTSSTSSSERSIDSGSLIPQNDSPSRGTSSLVETTYDSQLLEYSALESIFEYADVLPCYSSTVHCSGVMKRKIEYQWENCKNNHHV